MKKVLFILLIFVSCLRSGNWVDRLQDADYSMVKIGKYSHTTRMTDHPTDSAEDQEWNDLINELRTTIEENRETLAVVAKHFFPEERSELIFKYKFTSIDEKRAMLILRYFAPISYPTILAGYQCQFVVDLEDGNLEQILLSEVPLEK